MEDQLPELLRPVSWIIGKWTCNKGDGKFPTIQDFNYNETIEFRQCGMQPLLSYTGRSTHPKTGNPMHLESGFLRCRANNQVSFMVAHNLGLTTLEEGELQGYKELLLHSKSITRMSGAKEPRVLEIRRIFTLVDENTLIQKLSMSTSTTLELTEHLSATYQREI